MGAAGITPALAETTGAPKRSPELFLSIGQGDVQAVRGLLASGVDPNAQNTLGMSALTIAAGTGNAEIVRVLLEAGADIKHSSPFGTALTFATFQPNPSVVNLLLERGVDVRSPRPDRISPLMLAARAGNVPVIETLLKRKAEVNGADNHGSTPLIYAAQNGQLEAVRTLLRAGAKVDAADSQGWTPLLHAAVNGHAPVVTQLLKSGARVQTRDKHGRSALLLAASYGDHPATIRALLAAGAQPGERDGRGRTALALATARGYRGAAGALRGGAAVTAAAAPALRTPRKAAELGLKRIEEGMKVFTKRTGCFSCHHEGVARFTTGFARAKGYAIDQAFAQQQGARVQREYDQMLPLLKKAVENPAETKNVPIVDVGDLAPTNGTLLLGMKAHGGPATEAVSSAVVVLARTQDPDGAWRFGFVRAPMQSSFFNTTAQAIQAMRAYAPAQYAGEVAERTERAKQWLLKTEAKTTEDRVWRLLGLKWAGATAEERKQAAAELLATQRPDGGWGQYGTLASDAYATGSALFSLAQGGDLPVTAPEYRKGVRYLLRTQDDDGSWYVFKRAMPANNYFDAGYPHGQSQFSSQMGACWATLALILAAEQPGPGSVAVR